MADAGEIFRALDAALHTPPYSAREWLAGEDLDFLIQLWLIASERAQEVPRLCDEGQALRRILGAAYAACGGQVRVHAGMAYYRIGPLARAVHAID